MSFIEKGFLMKHLLRLFSVLLLNVILSIPLHAEVLEQTQLNYPVKTAALWKGEIHLFLEKLTPQELLEKYPQVADLDTQSLLTQKDISLVLSKSSFIVNKPSGFFDHEHMIDEKYLTHLLGNQTISKVSDNTFKTSSYKLKNYFDSDDMSTLPSTRITQAVTAARRLDVISQSATSVVLQEKSSLSDSIGEEVSLTFYVPMKETKTLIIRYSLTSHKTEARLKQEVMDLKNRIESFKTLPSSL